MALARAQAIIKRPADDAWVRAFGVTHLAGFVDKLSGQADVGGGGSIVPVGNIAYAVAARLLDLAAFLSCVVFVGQPSLRLRLNLKCVDFGFSVLEFSVSGPAVSARPPLLPNAQPAPMRGQCAATWSTKLLSLGETIRAGGDNICTGVGSR